MMMTMARLRAMTRSRPQLLSSRRSGCVASGATAVLVSAFGSMWLLRNSYFIPRSRTSRHCRKLSHRTSKDSPHATMPSRSFHQGLVRGYGDDSRPGSPPPAALFHENANHALLAIIIHAPAQTANRGDIGQNGHIRGCVAHLNVIRMQFQVGALGIGDLRNLLLPVYDKAARMNLHKIIGEEPGHGLGVAVVCRVQPDMVQDGHGFRNVVRRRFLRRLSQGHSP